MQPMCHVEVLEDVLLAVLSLLIKKSVSVQLDSSSPYLEEHSVLVCYLLINRSLMPVSD